jgi:phospholipid-translocating ATPase
MSSALRVVHGQTPTKNAEFPDNRISNTKYTPLTFLPKVVLEQFSLHMNRYFLLIACLQLFSVLTPVNPLTTWGPLLVIFTISAVKEAVDDIGRAREDRIANERPYEVFRDSLRVRVPAQEIRVGDIVLLPENSEVPCDLLLLSSSTKTGTVYLQTANLDGESDLKPRAPHPRTQELGREWSFGFRGVCECAPPNASVYEFDSRLWLDPSPTNGSPPGEPLSISGEQLLQQTCLLANTEWVVGMAVYTGNETKFGMNRGQPPSKLTQVDQLVNRVSVFIFLFQLALVVVLGSVGNAEKQRNGDEHWYLAFRGERTAWYEWLVIPLRFLLLNSTMIPISLKVTLDLCKLLYAKFINWDLEMYDAETQSLAHARNTSISEDLGQVEYVLTDKTGTLTRNIMLFHQVSIAGDLYDHAAVAAGADSRLGRDAASQRPAVLDMLLHFALNNTVVPTVNKAGALVYKGASPDEVALVKAAAACGVTLLQREGRLVQLRVLGREETYEVLEELKFSSDRKRMSVAVRAQSSRRIRLFMKGADDVVLARLAPGQQELVRVLNAQTEMFARQGLRTLYFAAREIDEAEFTAWQQRVVAANTAVTGRKREVERVYEELERHFAAQGVSAIEDKLQDGVPETIARLREAGIRFWMLTGDKYTTALQIARSSNLKGPDDAATLLSIEGRTGSEVKDKVRLFLGRVTEQRDQDFTVIVRGSTLELALYYCEDELRRLCMAAAAVIFCRLTPAQKADLVLLVRDAGHITLAIGDGGNDVAMIQQAHVGVGVRGREGMQAARASDYSIASFSALSRLVLVHGRYSYLRTQLVAQFSFYKSFLFCCVQIGFAFASAFSGATLFNSLCITVYNAALFVPIVSFVLDKDVSFQTLTKHPRFYRLNITHPPFTWRTMLLWNARAALQALAIVLVVFLAWGRDAVSPHDASAADWETMGIVAFSCYMWVQSLTMMLELHSIAALNWIAIWGMHVLTFCILIFTNGLLAFDSLNGYWTVFHAMGDAQFWLINMLVVAVCLVPVAAAKAYRFNYARSPLDELRLREHLKTNVSGSSPNEFDRLSSKSQTEP